MTLVVAVIVGSALVFALTNAFKICAASVFSRFANQMLSSGFAEYYWSTSSYSPQYTSTTGTLRWSRLPSARPNTWNTSKPMTAAQPGALKIFLIPHLPTKKSAVTHLKKKIAEVNQYATIILFHRFSQPTSLKM